MNQIKIQAKTDSNVPKRPFSGSGSNRKRRKCDPGPKSQLVPKQRELKMGEINRPELEAQRLELRRIINRSCNPFVYELTSSELKLAGGYVYINSQLNLYDTFFAFIPSRIGTDEALDSAATALIHLFADKRDQNSQALCTRKYASAITTLRNSMESASWRESDAALFAIFMLAFYEHKLRYEHRSYCEAHRKGMCAMLLAQAASGSKKDTEVLRSLLYQAWNTSFLTPLIRGTASPFENNVLLDLDPPEQFKLPPELAKLRKISNQLIIRLPALVAMVRQLRQGPFEAVGSLERKTSQRALDLLSYRDKDGENAVLHRVKIGKSFSESPLSQSSFQFEQNSEFKTTVYYWSVRILICRICLALLSWGVLVEDGACTEALLRDENEKSSMNMMMAWDYGQAHGAILGRTLLVPGYTFVWGVLNDHDTFRNLSSSTVKAWLLQKIHGFEAGMSLHVTERELDEAAEAFIGGPIGGLQSPALESFFGI